MVPVEWPIATPSPGEGPEPVRCADRDRLASVRADFFLDPGQRLSEQERSLMTAMLADLVAVVADEIRAAAGIPERGGELPTEHFEQLRYAGLLDIPELIAELLQRSEEERIASALRIGAAAKSRLVHSLAADQDSAIAAAAMALVLGRSRRRDRYGDPRVQLDDIPAEAAYRFVYSVAAAIALEEAADRVAGEGAAAVLARHDEGKRVEALRFALVHALDRGGRLNEEMLLAAAADGDVALLLEALARRAGTEFQTAWGHLRGPGRFALLLRMADVSRRFAAELAVCFGELLTEGPAAEVERFDTLDDRQVERARDWLRLDPHYRDALVALGARDG